VGVVGTGQRRLEGRAKVTGAVQYTADLQLPALAHARLVLSTHPHARLKRIDVSQASWVPGVLLALTGADLGDIDAPGPDQPLAREKVYYAGQPVAVVVAETEEQAADGAAVVEVEYEPLPAVVDPELAMREDAPHVLESHDSALDDAGAHGTATAARAEAEKAPNVTSQVHFEQGDAHAAFKDCQATVEGRYLVPAVHQGFLETHVSIARAEPDGGVTVWTSTQGAFLARRTAAAMLREPQSRIRVVPLQVGGGFGGKICLLEPLVIILSRRLGRPVQLALTRSEEFLMGRGGPAMIADLKLGADGEGNLKALWARVVFDNGAGQGGLAGLAGIFLGGTYRIPNLDFTGYDVATHKTPVGAYRAPGAPQAYFALESALDELARKLGQDPIDLRLRNAAREGDLRPDGVRWPRIGLVECLERARRHPLYSTPRAEGEGVGVAVGGWGGGREPAAAGCRVEPDGTLILQLGTQDITGSDTALAMVAAETFGVGLDRVRVESGDTGNAPYAGMAGGSKIIYTVGPAVQMAAAEARKQLLEIAAEEMEAAVEDLVVEDGQVRVSGVPGRAQAIGHLAGLAMQFGGRYAPVHGHGRTAVTQQSPMFTVQLARVQVDRETGGFRLTGFAAIQDVGRALNPPEVEAQIHGGTVQAVGRALGEHLHWDQDGQLRTGSFLDYGLPSIDQVPDIQVELVEVPSPVGPFGAKGVGEPPAIPGPAAVANAIRDAIGVRAVRLPLDNSELAGVAS